MNTGRASVVRRKTSVEESEDQQSSAVGKRSPRDDQVDEGSRISATLVASEGPGIDDGDYLPALQEDVRAQGRLDE